LAWTKLYRPIALLEVRKNVDPSIEDITVKEYMFNIGINNVRGGSYTEIELEDAQIQLLQKLQMDYRLAHGLCLECASSNLLADACPLRKKVGIDSQPVSSEGKSSVRQKCLRCGRAGHVTATCYAKTHVDGTSKMAPGTGQCVDVYVLQLEHGKYYVGATRNWERRKAEHFAGNGSVWTKKHRPTAVIEVLQNVDPLFEDLKVKEYIVKFGMNHVRGGSYSQVELEDFQIRALQTELDNASGSCFVCGNSDHFASACPQKKQGGLRNEAAAAASERIASIPRCLRCGRKGHVIASCFAKTHIDGKPISSNQNSNNGSGNPPNNEMLDPPSKCSRCGRTGHNTESCFAKTFFNGKPIVAGMDGKSEEREKPS